MVLYVSTIALLGFYRPHVTGRSSTIPLAALGMALIADWNVFATGGLETALYTFLIVLGWSLLIDEGRGPRGAAAAGLVFALAAMTRPEGLMPAGLGALYAMWARRPRRALAFGYVGMFLLAWLPYAVWKLAYYGDVLPNTYYAKSAALAWWSQGWLYTSLFFRKYWVLAASLPLAALARLMPEAPPSSGGAASRSTADAAMVLAAALALAQILFVTRVGGDFMFARLLLPAAPFLSILLEYGVARLARRRLWLEATGGAAALAALALARDPFPPGQMVGGIVHEWAFYTRSSLEQRRRQGESLGHYFSGLPVRIAIVGSQASLAWYADPAVAIEAHTGLTDRTVAHLALAKRGRVGHEKVAPIWYLLETRHVNFTLEQVAATTALAR